MFVIHHSAVHILIAFWVLLFAFSAENVVINVMYITTRTQKKEGNVRTRKKHVDSKKKLAP